MYWSGEIMVLLDDFQCVLQIYVNLHLLDLLTSDS